jgi:glycosyltransferase involved in cell wall biosynthesis
MHEGWGMVVMEAAAHGRPTLAFDVAGVRDAVVDGETGVLVKTEDEMIEEWLRLAGANGLRERLGAAARARVDDFGWSRTLEEFLSLAETIVSTGHRPASS